MCICLDEISSIYFSPLKLLHSSKNNDSLVQYFEKKEVRLFRSTHGLGEEDEDWIKYSPFKAPIEIFGSELKWPRWNTPPAYHNRSGTQGMMTYLERPSGYHHAPTMHRGDKAPDDACSVISWQSCGVWWDPPAYSRHLRNTRPRIQTRGNLVFSAFPRFLSFLCGLTTEYEF